MENQVSSAASVLLPVPREPPEAMPQAERPSTPVTTAVAARQVRVRIPSIYIYYTGPGNSPHN